MWLDKHGDPKLLPELDKRKQRQRQFIDLLLQARKNLQTVYDSNVDVERKKEQKDEQYEQLRQNYQALKASWDGYTGYDNWFSKPLNNARLVSVATYTDYLPAFRMLFLDSGENFEQFYKAAKKLADLSFDARQREMLMLSQRAESLLSATSQN